MKLREKKMVPRRNEFGSKTGEYAEALVPTPFGWAVYGIIVVGFCLALSVGMASGCAAWGRYQKRADANNNVKVTAIGIKNYKQRVEIEKQKARIRVINAIGIRQSQDHIAKTLTPLYVQWEAIQAQLELAGSPNSTFIYLPSGANGVPLVSTTPNVVKTGSDK